METSSVVSSSSSFTVCFTDELSSVTHRTMSEVLNSSIGVKLLSTDRQIYVGHRVQGHNVFWSVKEVVDVVRIVERHSLYLAGDFSMSNSADGDGATVVIANPVR